MAANAQQGKMNISHKNMRNYYKAQCLKDDAMAESIVEYKQIHSFHTVIHYNGDFHSRYHLGMAEKSHLLNPELKIAVITPVYVDNFRDLPEMIVQYQKDGDILIFLQKQEKGL